MRPLLTAAAVALIATPLLAADLPQGGGTVQMLIAKVEGDQLVTSATSKVQRAVTVTDDNGTSTITVTETVITSTARDLKYLKATDTDDKEVPTAELKDRLKNGGPVVFLNSPLDPTWKAKMKKGLLFVEYTAPKSDKESDGAKPEDKE